MAIERDITQNRDLTMTPDTFIFMQNVGKGGMIHVYKGPTVVNQTGQDQPVRYDAASKTYKPCSLEQAVQQCVRANEGDYVVLENPAEGAPYFPEEISQQARPLKKGRKTVIPGPFSEALWPGQSATVIEGHRLRSNQYLVAIVYNAEEAERNWETGTVVKAQAEHSGDGANVTENISDAPSSPRGLPKPESFAVGTRIIVKGSDVSFFIPCTGIFVSDDAGRYVREAVTLEQLEYCCLIDESGKKEYPRGPAVVFPRPTQVFEEDSKKRRKFAPIELNKINGIHLKVTTKFSGPDLENDITKERHYREGEELFVTGKTISIYYPREELSIIEYGQGNKKHFSTAIPKGEGRYVINRETGEIRLVKGPKMLLADPRTDIPMRRVLSQQEVELWYPGNTEAIRYNQDLARARDESPSGRSGGVSEGDWRKRQAKLSKHSLAPVAGAAAASMLMPDYSLDEFDPESVGEEGGAGGSITRGATYTAPRTLTLNTKFDGVPRIEVWSGFAILIVGAEGSRRVVQGPEVCLLEYDEKLGFMELSTGKPKTTTPLYKTAYLKVQNNQVGDIVAFESKDHVKGSIKISMRVNFEGITEEEQLRWFSVDNYVKYLTDHVRSIIAGVAKKKSVAEIKGNYVEIVRDAIIGSRLEPAAQTNGRSRAGLYFADNGMRVVEVEVLDLNLSDPQIAKLLDSAQHRVVESNIEVEQAQRELEATRQKERITQQLLEAQAETKQLQTQIQLRNITDEIELLTAKINVELSRIKGEEEKTLANESIEDLRSKRQLERAKAETEHTINVDTRKLELSNELRNSETESAVKRFEAAKNGLFEVLTVLGRDEMAVKLAEATNIERYLSGDNVSSSVANLLSIAPSMKEFFDRADVARKKAITNRLATEPASTR